MRKSLTAAMAALAVCALALAAAAQQERPVTTSKDKGDTVKINVSGRIVLDYVWRSKELAEFTDSFSGPAGGVSDTDDENTFEGYAAVRVDAELSDKVSAVIEVGTLRVAPVDVSGININFMGTSTGGAVGIREAHIKLGEFLMPELSVMAGIADWNFDVRGRGNAFAFDPRRSQSITRHFDSGAAQESALDVMGRANAPAEQYPVGGVVTYKRQDLQVDLVLLPGVIEQGTPCQDENLYALDVWYNLDQVGKGSRVGLIGAIHGTGPVDPVIDSTQNHCHFYTLGGGVVLKNPGNMEGLEFYGEVYKQFGKVAESVGGPGGDEDIDAKGLAFQIGAEYRFGDQLPLWVGVNYTYVSGDGDDDPTDTDANKFYSYENVSDLLIVEDMYFGLDIDANYTALKFSGGAALSVGSGKNNLELSAIVGLCKMQEKVTGAPATESEDNLGTEIDVRARWHLSKQASLTAAVAFLTGSDVMEAAMGGSAVDDAEDKCSLYTVGLDVKF